jgi:hypothetical protein
MQSECQIPLPTAICDKKSLLARAPAAFFAISPAVVGREKCNFARGGVGKVVSIAAGGSAMPDAG